MRGQRRCTSILALLLVLFGHARLESASIGELDRLLALHQPRPLADRNTLDHFVRQKDLVNGPVTFVIQGFASFGCDKCHTGDELIASAETRMRQAIQTLEQTSPGINIPLRQYIIQPYADNWLHGQQLAHTTFDTIRFSPRGILIDNKVYRQATHLHETLHLTQAFLGHVNELEAYGLNARTDPRFLILNYPYFADVMTAYFVPEFEQLLKSYFARDTSNDLRVPREAQWYLTPFEKMDKLASAIVKMTPLLAEVGQINREQYLSAAYQSDRTGIPSLALDLAAVKHLPLPPLAIPEPERVRAFELLTLQMEKTDNTRLGYVIDRKKEALLHLQHQLGIKDSGERLRLYFHYLQQRFILPDGQINLKPADKEDFERYVRARMLDIQNLMKREGITPIEQTAGRQWEEKIKKALADYETKKP